MRLLREGRDKEAYELILEYTPFPASVCGSVCPNLCMTNCSRQVVDQSIDMSVLGRAVKDFPAPSVADSLGKKVAIIGAGTIGLYLAKNLSEKGQLKIVEGLKRLQEMRIKIRNNVHPQYLVENFLLVI